MKPYYSESGITIYHGDCREILPSLSGDAVVTDPPYGLDFRGERWDGRIPLEWFPLAMKCAPLVTFTTAPTTVWQYPVPTWMGCWYRPASSSRSQVGGFNHWSPILIYGKPTIPVDCINLHAIANASPDWIEHPSPKPEQLALWMVSWAVPKHGLLIDPFAGSGTFLRAAKDCGCRAIGIEIEESYCREAVKRLAQGALFQAEVA